MIFWPICLFQTPLAAAFQKLTAGLENEIAFNWQDLETTFAFRPVGLRTFHLTRIDNPKMLTSGALFGYRLFAPVA